MRKPIKIEQVLFPDGVIEEYGFNADELTLLFRDSSDTKLLLRFSGSIAVQELGSIGLSICRSHLDKEGDGMLLRLLDDDLKEMLIIKFHICQIEQGDRVLAPRSTG